MIVAVVVVSPPYQIFVIFIYFEIGDGEEVYQLYIHQAKFDAIYRCLRDTLTLKAMYYQYQVVRFKMIKMNSVRAMHQQNSRQSQKRLIVDSYMTVVSLPNIERTR